MHVYELLHLTQTLNVLQYRIVDEFGVCHLDMVLETILCPFSKTPLIIHTHCTFRTRLRVDTFPSRRLQMLL
jgi:hypothetical protein